MRRLWQYWTDLWGVNSLGGQVFLLVGGALFAWTLNAVVGVPVDRDVEVTLVLASVFATLLLPAHSFDLAEKWPRFILTFFGSLAYGIYVGGVLFELIKLEEGQLLINVAPSAVMQIAAAAAIGFGYWAAGGMSRGGGDRWSIFLDGATSESKLVRLLVNLKMRRKHGLANDLLVAVSTFNGEEKNVFEVLDKALEESGLPDTLQRDVRDAIREEVVSYWKSSGGDSQRRRRRVSRTLRQE